MQCCCWILILKEKGDFMRNIGERIKTLREQNGYTQTVLAKKLGLSRSAVNAWEMGVSIPSTQYLVELSQLFNVSTDFILCIARDEKEMLDISFLGEDEKSIMHAMLNHFRKYNDAIDILRDNGLIQPGDELYDAVFCYPGGVKRTLIRSGKIDKYGNRLDPED